MADIELVIKVPDIFYTQTKSYVEKNEVEGNILSAVAHGTPLPKGHGRILDEKDILDTENNDGGLYDLVDMPDYIAGVKAIIEADKAESEVRNEENNM